MLHAKPLDDRSYDEILESAMNRLPALCPTWTDYNAHDPGVTLVELFSWYEEMQRYHLDFTTEAIRCRLLSLLGEAPRSAAAARCLIDLSGREGVWPEGTQFRTKEGISFELEATAEVGQTALTAVLISDGKREINVTQLLLQDAAVIQPFFYGGERTELVLKFSGVEQTSLRLWFGVSEPEKFPRNPFADAQQMPRRIAWYWNGMQIAPTADETHALSVSGFAELPVYACDEGTLRLVLTDPGCEEIVRLSAIRLDMYPIVQQQTWRRLIRRTVPARPETEVSLCYTPAIIGALTLFLRTEDGWEQVAEYQDVATDTGRQLTLNTVQAMQDGEENLMIVVTAPDYFQSMFLDSDGLPGQEILFSVDGGQPVGEMLLICDSLDTDGEIRPMVWRRVTDLSTCGPRDRVFCYDALQEKLVFGDGLHGAIVPAGENAILPASLHISACKLGNIPGGAVLQLTETDERPFFCTPGAGGAAQETAEDATIRFLHAFPNTRKCATAADYERLAMQTPGLRMVMAKAIPGYNPKEPSGNATGSVVSVVVLPFSQTPFAKPNQWFLDAVRRQLERYRPICTQVDVCPPRYFQINLQLYIRGDSRLTEQDINRWLRAWYAHRGIGRAVVKNDLLLYLQKQPGVWKIDRLEIDSATTGCTRTGSGDMILPPDGIAYPGKLELVLKSQFA